MIKNTFCILDGIGEKLERHLWKQGILTWKDFTDSDELLGFTSERKRFFDESLSRASEELDAGNAQFIYKRIKRREHWRLFDFFKESAVCLDIETNGLQPDNGGYVTVVGLYDGFEYKYFLKGENLTTKNLSDELAKYKCLITFYGAAFDIPFLIKAFHGIEFNIPHFDLCFAARKLKLQGGLKKLEQEFGIEREESVKGLDGYDAVRLWEFAKRNSAESLDLLIRYNHEDTVNLMQMAPILYEKLRQSTGIEEYLSCGVS